MAIATIPNLPQKTILPARTVRELPVTFTLDIRRVSPSCFSCLVTAREPFMVQSTYTTSPYRHAEDSAHNDERTCYAFTVWCDSEVTISHRGQSYRLTPEIAAEYAPQITPMAVLAGPDSAFYAFERDEEVAG